MNSPYSLMYVEIMQRIASKVPQIRYINIDNGQLEYEGERAPVSFPCVLIDFDNFSFDQMSGSHQESIGNVIIKLAVAPFSDTSNFSPTNWQDKGLEYFELEWQLNKALHGFEGNSFGSMARTSDNKQKRDDNLRVRELIYNVAYQDNSASPILTTITLPPLNPTFIPQMPSFNWHFSRNGNNTILAITTNPSINQVTQMELLVKCTADGTSATHTTTNLLHNFLNINLQNNPTNGLYDDELDNDGNDYAWIIKATYTLQNGDIIDAFATLQGTADVFEVVFHDEVRLGISNY